MFEFITFSLFASFLSSDTLRWLRSHNNNVCIRTGPSAANLHICSAACVLHFATHCSLVPRTYTALFRSA